MIFMELPSVPPTVNHAYITDHFGKRVLSAEGRKYKRETVAHLCRAYPTELATLRTNQLYRVAVAFFFPVLQNKGWPKKAENRYKHLDVTNRLKLFEDALQEATGVDDSHHERLVCAKIEGTEATQICIWTEDEGVPEYVSKLLGLI